jgi:hypothetical protein
VPTRDAIFDLIKELKTLGTEVPREMQSYLTSQVLRQFVITDRDKAPSRKTLDAAADTLATALEQGVLSKDPRIVDRILTTGPIYRYPFANYLLREQLDTRGYHRHSRTIFGADRVALVHDYIVGVMQSGMIELDVPTAAFLRTFRRGEPESNAPQRLRGLLNGLLTLANDRIGYDHSDAYHIEATGIEDVTAVFDHILSLFRVGSPQTAEQEAFVLMCQENVSGLLPVFPRPLGEQAIAAAIASELV